MTEPLDPIRAKNGKTTPTTAADILRCPVFRLGFADYRQGRFLEDWQWRDIITAMGLSGQVLGRGSWSYERGQSFAQCAPQISFAQVGAVTAQTVGSPAIRALERALAAKDVI